MPRVLNSHTASPSERRNAVFVGRPTKWGNPFILDRNGTREEVIDKYRIRLLGSPRLLSELSELKGRDLLCYCAPKPCHADVLLEMANAEGLEINVRE